jgi:hypothetical protein
VPRVEKHRKRSTSKRLVVDASVLHAASPEGSTHPTGSRCRDMLATILNKGHEAAITDDIMNEWRRHSSTWSKQWRYRMNARGLAKRVTAADCADVLTAIRRSRLLSERDAVAVEKDIHLVAAVRFVDRSIPAVNRAVLSIDELMRNILRRLAAETHALDRINWANPVTEFESLHAWFVDGRTAAARWQLTTASTA